MLFPAEVLPQGWDLSTKHNDNTMIDVKDLSVKHNDQKLNDLSIKSNDQKFNDLSIKHNGQGLDLILKNN